MKVFDDQVPYCARGSWRFAILFERIRELIGTRFKVFSDASGVYYGAPQSVRDLISAAREAHEDGDLDKAERCCEIAERKLLAEGRKFQNRLRTTVTCEGSA